MVICIGSGSLVAAPTFPAAYERIRDKDHAAARLVPVQRSDVPKDEPKSAEPDTFGMTTPRGYFQGQVLNKVSNSFGKMYIGKSPDYPRILPVYTGRIHVLSLDFLSVQSCCIT